MRNVRPVQERRSREESRMPTIREALSTKPSEVWRVAPGATVYQALVLMAERDIGALPVVEESRMIGIFSERDYARNLILKGKSSKDTPVRDLMSSPVLYVRPEQTIDDCMALMTEKHVRHLPVLEGDELIGMISIGDVVRRIISEQDYTIELLENYIKGLV
jgi:CBS domain-containing protein